MWTTGRNTPSGISSQHLAGLGAQQEVSTTNCSLVTSQGFSVHSGSLHISATMGATLGEDKMLSSQDGQTSVGLQTTSERLCLCRTSLTKKHWCWSCVLLPLCHRAAPWAMCAASCHLDAQLHTNVTNLSSIQDTLCILKFQSVKLLRRWYIFVQLWKTTKVLTVKLLGTYFRFKPHGNQRVDILLPVLKALLFVLTALIFVLWMYWSQDASGVHAGNKGFIPFLQRSHFTGWRPGFSISHPG